MDKSKKMQHIFVPIITIMAAVFFDQWTKFLAVMHLKDSPAYVIIKNVFELHYLENQGAAFGILQNQQWFFLIGGIAVLIGAAFIYIRMPHTRRFTLLRICLILIVSGAIGNMIDRVRLQDVVDFFYFKLIDFPIFNVADIYVTVAAISLIILILFYYKEEEIDELFARILKHKGSENDERI